MTWAQGTRRLDTRNATFSTQARLPPIGSPRMGGKQPPCTPALGRRAGNMQGHLDALCGHSLLRGDEPRGPEQQGGVLGSPSPQPETSTLTPHQHQNYVAEFKTARSRKKAKLCKTAGREVSTEQVGCGGTEQNRIAPPPCSGGAPVSHGLWLWLRHGPKVRNGAHERLGVLTMVPQARARGAPWRQRSWGLVCC